MTTATPLYTHHVMDEKLTAGTKGLMGGAAADGSFSLVWLQAFVSVIIISILGLIPIICMPRIQRTRYQNDLLQFLIGLAIGTLTADAMLHLLPISGQHRHSHAGHSTANSDHQHGHSLHATNNALNDTHSMQNSSSSGLQHDHDHDHDHDDNHYSHDEGFWFGFMALVGILGFLVLERLMVLVTDACTHREHKLAASSGSNNNVAAVGADAATTELKDDVEGASELKDLPLVVTDPHLHHHQHHHQNHHQHQHHHLNNKTKSFMFMIITGDGLHNFFDGIAIGVSYSSSLTVGISTSIAILCHELPHEIGDFAVLIKSGMTIKRAVLYNTLSSILCLLGATTGVFIGKIDIGWVSALIAGMFLYISLVDMMPQLDCYPTRPAPIRALKLLIQVCGIALGVLIMSLIATYESKLHLLVSAFNNH